MKKSPFRLLLLLGIIFSPVLARDVFACQCDYLPTPYKAYQQAKVIFVGEVVSITDHAGKELSEGKLTIGDYYQKFNRNITERNYRFEVQEWFKGKKLPAVTVSTQITMCQGGLGVGESYLIYAKDWGDPSGKLTTGLYCSRSRELEAARGDIYFLRRVLENKPEPRLYGSVGLEDKDPSTGSFRYTYLEGIKIIAEGDRGRFEALTDKNGVYSFYEIPNAKYRLYPELPDKYTPKYDASVEVALQDKEVFPNTGYRSFIGSTVYSDFSARWNNSIGGRVLDAEGKFVEHANVNLVPLKGANDNWIWGDGKNAELLKIRDAESRMRGWELSGYAPGKYILTVEILAPFVSGVEKLRMFYPQATTIEKSEIFDIAGYDKRNIDIKLPDGFVTREIEGTFDFRGFPVHYGYVSLEKLEDSGDKNNVTYDRQRVENGKFKFQAFENAEYWIHAEVYQEKATPVKIKVGKTNAPVTIKIPPPNKQ